MKTTTKLLLSLSLLLVPQISFSAEFEYDSGDDTLAPFNGSIPLANDDAAPGFDGRDEDPADTGFNFDGNDEVSSVKSDNDFVASRPIIRRTCSSAPSLINSSTFEHSLRDSNSSDDSSDSDSDDSSDSDSDDSSNPTTFSGRMKSRSKNAKAKIARFYKNHPNAIKRSAIAGGTVALAGGAATVYTKSSIVKENVDKAAACIAEGAGKVATKLSETYKAAKDRITKATATTRAAVDGEIEELDKTYFSRADAIVLAGAAGISYGAYKAAPTVKKAATDLGTWISSKASEASSSDTAIDLKVKAQIVAHYVQDHKVAFAAPVVALAAAYAGFKVYKKVTAESTATTEPTEVTEDVLTPDLD